MAYLSNLYIMSTDKKVCPICQQIFGKPINESREAWENRRVYCSKACMSKKVNKVCLLC